MFLVCAALLISVSDSNVNEVDRLWNSSLINRPLLYCDWCYRYPLGRRQGERAFEPAAAGPGTRRHNSGAAPPCNAITQDRLIKAPSDVTICRNDRTKDMLASASIINHVPILRSENLLEYRPTSFHCMLFTGVYSVVSCKPVNQWLPAAINPAQKYRCESWIKHA